VVYTIRLKNRVIGFKNSVKEDGFGTHAGEEIVNNLSASEPIIATDSKDKHIEMLKNRIRVLELALQEAKEEAFQAGYEEGKETTLTETKRQIEDLSEEFVAMIHSLKEQFSRVLGKMNKPLVKMAMKVAENIIGREIQSESDYYDILRRRIKQLLIEAADQSKITIHINPNQLDWVTGTEILDSFQMPSNAEINFIKDNEIKAGECLLESEEYILEGALSRQLENLEKQVLLQEELWKK